MQPGNLQPRSAIDRRAQQELRKQARESSRPRRGQIDRRARIDNIDPKERAELRGTAIKQIKAGALVAVCSNCNAIKEGNHYYKLFLKTVFDRFIRSLHAKGIETHLSHGVCGTCAKELYPDFYDKLIKGE